MRIAIVTAWYPSKKNPLYGVFIQNQVQALSEHCETFVLLLTWSLIPFVKERKEGKVTIIEKGDFYFPNASEQMLNFWASRYVRFFKRIHAKHHFDLVHCHDHYGAFVGNKITGEILLPYICTMHNSNIMTNQLVDWKKAYIPRILKNAGSIVAVGTKLAQTLRSVYRIENVKVIPNFIDTNRFCPRKTDSCSDFRFLFIGGLESHKGILELVTAFHHSKIKDASLHIVGSGILDNKLKEYINRFDLHENVLLYGDVPNERLPEIYNSADVLVSVSEYETFGVAILEAMSCGLPVLCTSSGGPEDFVADFTGILIDERTIKSISDGLIKIKATYDQFDPEKIRQYVIDNFGAQKVIGLLLEEYKSLLDA
ncbi:MAG: glycosyltransferase [Bacteroidota bacterium]